jgi:hypothetical protein
LHFFFRQHTIEGRCPASVSLRARLGMVFFHDRAIAKHAEKEAVSAL